MVSVPLKTAHILLVDDEPFILETIGLYLEDEGFKVTMVDGGDKALDLLGQHDFDLIVTDLSMPGVDGFQVMTAAKKLKPDTPIIILTGQGTLDNAVKAIQHGAYDFVTKPVEDLTVFLISINRAVEKRNMLLAQRDYLSQIERQNRILWEDMEAARRIQLCMIQRDYGQVSDFLDITARYLPAKHLGGDFYDAFFLPPGFVAFYIADVAGHGVSAAMVTAFAKQTVIKVAEKVTSKNKKKTPSPKEILKLLNREMMAQGFESNSVPIYLTIFLLIYNPDTDRIRYSNGGHSPVPRHLNSKGRLARLHLEGNPVGLFNKPKFHEKEIKIQNRDRLFFCTDGLVEARGEDHFPFGSARLDQYLSSSKELNSVPLADGIIDRVMEHISPCPQVDDISLLVVSPVKADKPSPGV